MDVAEAERMLRSLVNTAPAEEGTGRNSRITFCYTPSKAYPVYRLPQTTLFTQLTSFVEPSLHVFATFYGGRLLLADEDSLSRYIRQLDNDEVLDGALAYRRDGRIVRFVSFHVDGGLWTRTRTVRTSGSLCAGILSPQLRIFP